MTIMTIIWCGLREVNENDKGPMDGSGSEGEI